MNTADHDQLQEDPTAGSPLESEPAFLAVGKLRRAHGVKGEMVMDIYTDFPERLKPGVPVYLGAQHTEMRIRSSRPNDTTLLIGFKGFDTPESVASLRNQVIFVRADDRPPLPDGEYYHHQLLGLRVEAEDGRQLGELVEILSSPANDVYIIQPETGAEILIPALKSVILDVDLALGVMRVHLLPGLIPE